MLKSQTIAIEMSKIRERANNPDASNEDRIAAGRELRDYEQKYRAALQEEGSEVKPLDPGETREMRELRDRFSVAEVIRAGVEGRATSGAELELQQHIGGGQFHIPIEVLREQRAAVAFTGDEEGQSQALIDQVFPESVMAFAGVDLRSVPVGEQLYPVLTTGVTIHSVGGSADAAETDAAIGVTTLTPKRLQGNVAVRREHLAIYSGLENDLRSHLNAAVMDGMDKEVITRTSAGLIDFGTDPTTPTAATTAAQAMALAYGNVDGLYAANAEQVRLLVGTGANGSYGYLGGLAAATDSDLNVAEKLEAVSGGLRVSSHIPAYASNHQEGVAIKGPARRNIVAASWGVQVMPDPYTRAVQGEIRLYVVGLFDFAITRQAGFSRFRIRTS